MTDDGGQPAVHDLTFSCQIMDAFQQDFHFYKLIFSLDSTLNQELAAGLQLICGNAAPFPLGDDG